MAESSGAVEAGRDGLPPSPPSPTSSSSSAVTAAEEQPPSPLPSPSLSPSPPTDAVDAQPADRPAQDPPEREPTAPSEAPQAQQPSANPTVGPAPTQPQPAPAPAPMAVETPELDEFGLPVRQFTDPPTPIFVEEEPERPSSLKSSAFRKLSLSRVISIGSGRRKAVSKDRSSVVSKASDDADAGSNKDGTTDKALADKASAERNPTPPIPPGAANDPSSSSKDTAEDASKSQPPTAGDTPSPSEQEANPENNIRDKITKENAKDGNTKDETKNEDTKNGNTEETKDDTNNEEAKNEGTEETKNEETKDENNAEYTEAKAKAELHLQVTQPPPEKFEDRAIYDAQKSPQGFNPAQADGGGELGFGVSEFSHQQLIVQKADKDSGKKDEWQEMPAYAPYDMYDDDNRLIAREHHESEDDEYGYSGLGGAGKGYTKVLLDDDAESATSMDENTQYLFKDAGAGTSMLEDEDAQRDAVSQLQATKNLLTEGQRIAYVGLTRLELYAMIKEVESIKQTKKSRKEVRTAAESIKMWSQKMMIRLYTHMDISPAEQLMIEQLSDHGVIPADLTPVLMANARVKNPMAADDESIRSSSISLEKSSRASSLSLSKSESEGGVASPPPPPYSARGASSGGDAAGADTDGGADDGDDVRTPSQLPTTAKIDIDLRWTVLCDLFLVLIADSIYDSRSRVLLEKVGKDLDIPWLDISRFEKKVTDALEMQQNAERENWNEDEHMENRRKMALKRRYVMMGLATVGGGLVIGLSAGLLAPVIGAGLAAGFTTIGVSGTSGFLAGAGGAAVITSASAASGGIIGVRAANRRTGAVKTFEYRPLHNNKRVNLIVTVCGWMTGKVDDVRLPFSTVDPVMGDIYSVLWEPEMLTSMGDTINILATEALTQGLQQLLGSTILISLMAALQLPVVLSKLSYLIDNPWAVSLDRATAAGLILADSLIDRNLGTRPITLVGYSLGSRVIFSCLLELARKGALGLVQNAYLFGSPVVVKEDEYLRARTVVSGRFVNGYNRNDWILGYLFRLTNGGIRRVGGLAAVDGIPGLENMDLTDKVKGHMDYRTAMPRLLRECGWSIESDEFTEIEDPDPENHNKRQRELIDEIEEARKELEREGKGESKGAFAFFNRRKKGQRKEWELYQESGKGASGDDGSGNGKTEDGEGNNHGVLFDVDAIRAELAKEQQHQSSGQAAEIDPADEQLLQVREIKSTLPPMKLDIDVSGGRNPSPSSPKPAASSPKTGLALLPPSTVRGGSSLRETRSAEVLAHRSSPSHDYGPPSSRDHYYRASHEYRPATTDQKAGLGFGPGIDYHSSPYVGKGYGEDDDGGVQMTFDTSFDDGRPPTPPRKDSAAPSRGSLAVSGSGAAGTGEPGTGTVTSPVPNITLSDPWAREHDDDDDDFGKEKEISMTFA